LEQIRQWPVDHAAATIVSAHGVVASAGEVDRVFPLASVTKLLVAYAALVAVEEEAIELDQPAGPPGSTVRHLLAHASGLAFDSHRVLAEPGARRIYSSTGFEVLADSVTAQTDIGFPRYLHEAVLAPLGMSSTELIGPAGSGAVSTATDLSRFGAELLNPTLVHRSTMEQARSVQFPGLDGVVPGYGPQRPNDWGLGFEIRGAKNPHWTGTRNSPGTHGHFGQSGTFLWVDPAQAICCVVLTDRAFGDWAKTRWTDFNDAVITDVSAVTRRG
jgi:CubicO group peptidase (beta-lactamase class C family)